MQEITDELLKKIQSGNLAAFEELLFKFERPIFSYIYRLTQSKQDAQELVQDTFLKVYKNIHKINEEKKFSAWVYKIATNTTYDFFRKKKREIATIALNEERQNLETINEDSAYYMLDDPVFNKGLDEALAKLKPMYRAVILAYFQQELSYQEIAESLNIPINSVKTYLFRAKKELKNSLQDK